MLNVKNVTDSITDAEWGFFLRGAAGVESGRSKKPPQAYWLNAQQWDSICDLESSFPFFQGLRWSSIEQVVRIHIGSFKIVNHLLFVS
jgi:hypothetical protein